MTDSTHQQFIAWQCRIRQMSVRDHQGRPLDGMRARIEDDRGAVVAEAVTMLILHKDPAAATDAFRHIVKKTHDPKSRRDDALKLLSSVHYQYPEDFAGVLTAMFSEDSALAGRLTALGRCRLSFSQFGQSFAFTAGISLTDRESPAWQATFWHNHMFSPALSGTVSIVEFNPEWPA